MSGVRKKEMHSRFTLRNGLNWQLHHGQPSRCIPGLSAILTCLNPVSMSAKGNQGQTNLHCDQAK
ncbi:hypothetical protein B0O80DRAFT_460013 [Mortierella sp. GBAus27b]|nr:hypothetical protein B0O80DRAFT_460013 [Mortierella sp. GBAus27b]